MKLFGAAASDNQNLGARTAKCQFFGARSRGIEIVAGGCRCSCCAAEASAVKFLPPITRAPPLRGLLEFCTRAQQKHAAYKYARLSHKRALTLAALGIKFLQFRCYGGVDGARI
jgi:hypothetical protein